MLAQLHVAADWQAMLFSVTSAFFAQHTFGDVQSSFWHRSHWKTLHFKQRILSQQMPTEAGGAWSGQLYVGPASTGVTGLDASIGATVSAAASAIATSASANVTSGTLEHPSVAARTRDSTHRTPSA